MSKLFKLLLTCEEYGKFEDHVLVLMIDSIGDGRRAERWLQDWASS
jgi:hypothetical protein